MVGIEVIKMGLVDGLNGLNKRDYHMKREIRD